MSGSGLKNNFVISSFLGIVLIVVPIYFILSFLSVPRVWTLSVCFLLLAVWAIGLLAETVRAKASGMSLDEYLEHQKEEKLKQAKEAGFETYREYLAHQRKEEKAKREAKAAKQKAERKAKRKAKAERKAKREAIAAKREAERKAKITKERTSKSKSSAFAAGLATGYVANKIIDKYKSPPRVVFMDPTIRIVSEERKLDGWRIKWARFDRKGKKTASGTLRPKRGNSGGGNSSDNTKYKYYWD